MASFSLLSFWYTDRKVTCFREISHTILMKIWNIQLWMYIYTYVLYKIYFLRAHKNWGKYDSMNLGGSQPGLFVISYFF